MDDEIVENFWVKISTQTNMGNIVWAFRADSWIVSNP